MSLGHLSSEPQGLPVSASSTVGSQGHTTRPAFFLHELGSKRWSSCLQGKLSPTKPSPQGVVLFCFFSNNEMGLLYVLKPRQEDIARRLKSGLKKETASGPQLRPLRAGEF